MIRPLFNNILVKPEEMKSSFAVQDALLENFGKVVAIGEDVKCVKVGDLIFFTTWGIKDIVYKDEKYHFVPEDSNFLLGVYEETPILAE